MKTVKSFSKGEYTVLMVVDPSGFYRVITTNSRSVESGVQTTYSKASETFDKFVASVLSEKEVEYAPV